MSGVTKRNRLYMLAVMLAVGTVLGLGLWGISTGTRSAQGLTGPAPAREARSTALGGMDDRVRGQVTPQLIKEADFKTNGFPTGNANVVARHQIFPPGFTLKHAHGGPTLVFVVSGSLTVTDSDGTVATYNAGDYFTEPPGHIHTASSPSGVELSSLYILPDGADATIPVP